MSLFERLRQSLPAAENARRKARRKRKPAPGARSDVVAGVALTPWLECMAGLPCLGGRLVTNPPTLHIRRANSAPRSRLGFACYDRHRIQVTAYPEVRAEDVLETLLHEVVHLSSLELRRHDNRFRRTLTQAARECFGVDCDPSGATYAVDRRIVEALSAFVASGRIDLQKAEPVRASLFAD